MTLQTGKKYQSNAGFTLIELVFVILIISILVALSTPLFKRTFTNLELKNTSFNIAKIISYAREMAIIKRANYRVNFDPEKGKTWITRLDTTAEEGPPAYKRIGGRYGRVFSLPGGVMIEAETEEITFYPDGRASLKGEIKITDESRRGYLLHVREFGASVKIEEIGSE
jgi:prepilin-type N-terminal cleavage/methylation domain-containing protein